VQTVGPAKWPCNPALPSTYPMRNHEGTNGLLPTGGMPPEAALTPAADRQPEPEEAHDDVPGEADDARPE
jgi:hypothetical protein